MKVQQALMFTNLEYEMTIMAIWSTWCGRHANNDIELQKLMISKPLFNWWYKQYQILESEFLEDILPYSYAINKKDALKAYTERIINIYQHYSKKLIHKAIQYDTTANNKQD